MIDSHHRWWSSSMIRSNLTFRNFIKPHVLWSLFFGTPPKNPPPDFPPRVQNLAIFGTPPGPPFFEVLAQDPLIQDPCPLTSWCFLILWFYLLSIDLRSPSSSMMLIVINFIYNYVRLLSMHQGAPSFIRLNDYSSRVLLQKNTLPLPITMAKLAFLPPPTAQECILPLYIGYIYPFIG